jgi:hypothetical protein
MANLETKLIVLVPVILVESVAFPCEIVPSRARLAPKKVIAVDFIDGARVTSRREVPWEAVCNNEYNVELTMSSFGMVWTHR